MPVIVRLTGRCADGAERDGGRVTHVVVVDGSPAWGTALCGAKPGRLSNGFVESDGTEVPSCPRCRAKAERLS